ncbi:unnamed protein product, partial [Lymnaea stagnalis]
DNRAGPEKCSTPDLYMCSGPQDDNSDTSEKKAPLCVPPSWLCDGDKDCLNGDDELNCSISRCDSKQFECSSSSKLRCISISWQCDGEKDCDLGEDEAPEECRTKTKKGAWSRG